MNAQTFLGSFLTALAIFTVIYIGSWAGCIFDDACFHQQTNMKHSLNER